MENKRLESLLYDISVLVRLYRAAQEHSNNSEDLSEREILLMGLLSTRDKMTITEIKEMSPRVSLGTISTTVTRLWKEKQFVDKSIDVDNPRSITVSLTEKGLLALAEIRKHRADTFTELLGGLALTNDERIVFETCISRAVAHFKKMLLSSNSGS